MSKNKAHAGTPTPIMAKDVEMEMNCEALRTHPCNDIRSAYAAAVASRAEAVFMEGYNAAKAAGLDDKGVGKIAWTFLINEQRTRLLKMSGDRLAFQRDAMLQACLNAI